MDSNLTNQIKELKQWTEWACNETSVSIDVMVAKADEKFFKPYMDGKGTRLCWSTLIWASKAICMQTNQEYEGIVIHLLISKALINNPLAFKAIVLNACTGLEQSCLELK